MKGIVEFALVGLIGTATIMLGIITPSLVIKSTIHQQTDFTYKFEKMEHTLLSFLSSTINGKDAYELMGINFLVESTDLVFVLAKLGSLVSSDLQFCLSVINPSGLILQSLGNSCDTETDFSFKTVFALPYNNDALVKVIRIGIE